MKLSSLEKAIKLIELLGNYPKGISLSHLSEQSGLPISSVHHILSTFQEYDMVRQEKNTKFYMLGLKFLTISRKLLDSLNLRTVARPLLEEFQEQTGEMVFLSVLSGGKVVYLDKLQTPGHLVLATEVGYSLPPHACTSGKTLMAWRSQKEVMDIYPTEVLPPHRKNTVMTRTMLLKELEEIRAQGYCIGTEQYFQGIRGVAAPILIDGQSVASVCMAGPISYMTMDRVNKKIVPLLMKTVSTISTLLGQDNVQELLS